MEKKKLYIVSFGDSDKYLMEYNVPDGATDLVKPNPFEKIEKRLTDFLHRAVPEAEDITYFTSPRATEVAASHRSRYSAYPPLDEDAVVHIEKVLLREVRDRLAVRQENLDAPYASL